MSVESNIKYSIEHYGRDELDGAFIHACIAIDAVAKSRYPLLKNNERNKKFIDEKMLTITRHGFPGIHATSISYQFEHHSIRRDDNRSELSEIIYHVLRCELLHEAKLSDNLRFVEETVVADDNNSIILPKTLVKGLIGAVIEDDISLKKKFGYFLT
ncbi:MAG: hypothetical protein A2504_14620 [Bdellovibrionales bacterium RIFOXYD12_FULL_39_22]|nr:MAG: hypothetical protein A2385_15100 [Bdellovibrionales bacterium RIFOXYB1_FULL_39_21]OFZ40540.1 MAG: hypothetical protein A2485_13570 [Bdellovibrionales bacterium RIFOXYC12_FULL_39_17]OFZ49544.1 MAG: hypothetical protein A2404_07835 [Bdellovibrionales bacterium RIFOXYC1_FULL_39_130]OFZ71957.1 MAG: hypothetical protein A2451_05455 [Bdellovibrionales bacterium RIFOXYC2_FULL_39_8]OFZ77148.1 MAG: hypothetical protein A2560_17865 [Bdellovibrionales bacterium RIFOXYD1_FULL_39_84]OFZ91424.1 MAG: